MFNSGSRLLVKSAKEDNVRKKSSSYSILSSVVFWEPEPVFIYDLAHWKILIRNWFVWELILKLIFFHFYNCYSQRVEEFGGFFKKDWFFLKKTDSFKESDRTFSFIRHAIWISLFVDVSWILSYILDILSSVNCIVYM